MKRERFIDVIKGISILFVVVTHFSWTNQERLDYLFPFWIAMAVPLFMLVSGYVAAKSAIRRSAARLMDMYRPTELIAKLIRYTLPFAVIFAVEMVLYFKTNGILPEPSTMLKQFLMGGIGPGSYYYPVMIQFVLVFPLVYHVIQRYNTKGLLLCLFANILYEYLCVVFSMSGDTYRLLIFRYLSLIAFGCYIGRGYSIGKAASWVLFLLGLAMTYLISYQNIAPYMNLDWSSTSYLATLFILPIFALISKSKLACKPIELLGKASYNIYLTQMVYYTFSSISIPHRATQLCVNVAICLLGGIIYYYVETPITKWIVSKVKKTSTQKG